MKIITTWFILLGPPLVLLTDYLVSLVFDSEATITWVVRSWAARSSWPEFIFVAGALILYLHLFRFWPW